MVNDPELVSCSQDGTNDAEIESQLPKIFSNMCFLMKSVNSPNYSFDFKDIEKLGFYT